MAGRGMSFTSRCVEAATRYPDVCYQRWFRGMEALLDARCTSNTSVHHYTIWREISAPLLRWGSPLRLSVCTLTQPRTST